MAKYLIYPFKLELRLQRYECVVCCEEKDDREFWRFVDTETSAVSHICEDCVDLIESGQSAAVIKDLMHKSASRFQQLATRLETAAAEVDPFASVSVARFGHVE